MCCVEYAVSGVVDKYPAPANNRLYGIGIAQRCVAFSERPRICVANEGIWVTAGECYTSVAVYEECGI